MKIFFILSIFSSLVVFADPMPRGLIVKGEECSFFWAGDECETFSHPPGWQEIYAIKEVFHSGEKTCDLPVKNAKQAAVCCKQLGLRYVRVKLEKDKTVVPEATCKK